MEPTKTSRCRRSTACSASRSRRSNSGGCGAGRLKHRVSGRPAFARRLALLVETKISLQERLIGRRAGTLVTDDGFLVELDRLLEVSGFGERHRVGLPDSEAAGGLEERLRHLERARPVANRGVRRRGKQPR